MAHKEELSEQRMNTVINTVSKYQEVDCNIVVDEIRMTLEKELGVKIIKENSIKLKDVVEKLETVCPEQEFFYYFNTSNMKPDGRTCVYSG